MGNKYFKFIILVLVFCFFGHSDGEKIFSAYQYGKTIVKFQEENNETNGCEINELK